MVVLNKLTVDTKVANMREMSPKRSPKKEPRRGESVAESLDKRQIVQSLSDYIRVFCGTHKGRFLLQDIEELMSHPVAVRAAYLDPFFAQRRQLLDCLFQYFKAGRMHPLHWFDVITAWKGGHARVMTFQEFSLGFTRYCDELGFAHWQKTDVEKAFRFLLRSDHPTLRRQDFRFAVKRNGLSRRKRIWINQQAKQLTKVQRFVKKIRAKFSDFCPSLVIRRKGKTITLHELESMLFLVLTDMAIFAACPHADQLLSQRNNKLDKKDKLCRLDSISDDLSSIGEGDGEGEGEGEDHDDCSVGSLLSMDSMVSMASQITKVPSQQTIRTSFQDISRASSSSNMQFARKGSHSSLMPRPPSEAAGNDEGAEEEPFPSHASHSHGPLRSSNALFKSFSAPPPLNLYDGSSGSSSEDDELPKHCRRQSQVDLQEETRKAEDQLRKLQAAARGPRAKKQYHFTELLDQEEMMHMQNLCGIVGTQTGAAGGQVRKSSIVQGGSKQRQSSVVRERSRSILTKHSIISRYTVLRESCAVVPSVASGASPTHDEYPDEDSWDDMAIFGKASAPPAPSPENAEQMEKDSMEADALADFEHALEDKKTKHLKLFQNVTDNFDRRVNLAKARLNKF